MTGGQAASPGRLYFRQLLAGRDFALADPLAGQMANYAYLLGDRSTGEALLVDPAYAPGELVDLVVADGLRVVGAILTHYHADHAGGDIFGHAIAGIAELLERVDVPVHVQRDEQEWVLRGTGVGRDVLVPHEAGDAISLGTIPVTCLHTPGHTPGSQCLLVGGRVVTGDTLFLNGCGRTDLPGGDPELLYESLTRTLAAVPDETVVFPGHAYDPAPSAPFSAVRRRNAVLVPRSREEWLARFAG